MTPEFDCVPPLDRAVLYVERARVWLERPDDELAWYFLRVAKEKYRDCMWYATGVHPRGVRIPFERSIWS